MSANDTAERNAVVIRDGFDSYSQKFLEITRRAGRTFEERNWIAGRNDALERLDLYETTLKGILPAINATLRGRPKDTALWFQAKRAFSRLVEGRHDEELAQTFFNSVTRKILGTVGIDREVEFFHLYAPPPPRKSAEPIYDTFQSAGETKDLVRRLLNDITLFTGFEDIDRDTELVAHEIDLFLWPLIRSGQTYVIETIQSLFFRNKEAYIVGRIVMDPRTIPFVIPLVSGDHGIYVDAVLLHEEEVSIVFSFAYSYFQVDIGRHDELITFLRSILPHKDTSELYASIGYNRHAKTVFYRDLHRFVHVSHEQFVIAPGKEGAVMIAFTLPHYNFVFKVIKDKPCFIRSHLETPKAISRDEVIRRYEAIGHRDRAGRLVDTQEFENLRFRRRRFGADLLNEFAAAAAESVGMDDKYVIVKHVFVQRKVVPLPIYFDSESDPEMIRRVLIDFGYFLKDLAAIGIFPGDLFNTWNYGVTQRRRVVLYDYDDVMPLEEAHFLEKPHPRSEAEEMSPEEDWVSGSSDEFFMDELERYSGIPYTLRGFFKSVHGDLYTIGFWNDMKARVREGDIVDVVPYDRSRRFQRHGRMM